MRWLSVNYIEFPIAEYFGFFGDDLFLGWRFLQGKDSIIYFADLIHPGITQDDLSAFMQLHSIK